MSTGTQQSVSISARAAGQVRSVLSAEPPGAMLRVAVEGGGCSGFRYTFDIVDTKNHDDLAIDAHGYLVVIDSVSMGFLEGSVIDFTDELAGASFKVRNPNARAACGCGISFTV